MHCFKIPVNHTLIYYVHFCTYGTNIKYLNMLHDMPFLRPKYLKVLLVGVVFVLVVDCLVLLFYDIYLATQLSRLHVLFIYLK